jgi:hypothetical protein
MMQLYQAKPSISKIQTLNHSKKYVITCDKYTSPKENKFDKHLEKYRQKKKAFVLE